MICERCGNDMGGNTVICPVCGTLTGEGRLRARAQEATNYGQYTQQDVPPQYERGYSQQVPPSPRNTYSYGPQQQMGYPPPSYQVPPAYQAGPVNITVVNNPPVKNDGALIAEVILSLFGIFGVGWLMAGETTTGIVLLICSVLVYWPVIILGTVFTLGLGLICLGPLAIGAIILNALLLNKRLTQRASQAQVFVVQQPAQMPPMPPRQ